MTQQEIFDKIALHLIKQGRQSRDGGSGCLYREAKTGLMCAVGVLIPDAAYDPEMENTTVGQLASYWSGTLPPDVTDPHNEQLLSDLQKLHDNGTGRDGTGFRSELFGHDVHEDYVANQKTGEFDITHLKKGLALIATKHGLEATCLS